MKMSIAQFRHFLLFVSGGGLSAIVDIGIIQVLLVSGFFVSIAVTAGFIGGLIVNYIFHLCLTFKSSSSVEKMLRFMVVVFVNYLITMAFVYVFNSILGFGVIFGKVCSLPLVAANGFLLSKYWVFR